MSDSLRPHESQHTRPPCPSPTPGVHSNPCPFSRWCYPTISSSVVPFSSHLQSFPASMSFQMSQLFASGGQSVRALASASVLPVNIQGWFPLGSAGLIFLSKGFSRVFSNTTVWKHRLFSSVQFSRSVVSDSLLPHESWHARPPCPSPTPGVHSDSRPSSRVPEIYSSNKLRKPWEPGNQPWAEKKVNLTWTVLKKEPQMQADMSFLKTHQISITVVDMRAFSSHIEGYK